LELAIAAKDRDQELLEENHRVELRVYQQKVKHLEYEHRSNIKAVDVEGESLNEADRAGLEMREREEMRAKEQLKQEIAELEVTNAGKIAEMRQQLDKQLVKMRQQFEEGLSELTIRCENRLEQLEKDLELRRRVEIHEVEERKNLHINDLIKNHRKAFAQMKSYYNDVTSGNLQLIKSLQKQVEELKARASNNKKMLLDFMQENQKLSEPLSKVSSEITELQTLLKERQKDRMALENANSRLVALSKKNTDLKKRIKTVEANLSEVQVDKDEMYSSYEDALRRIEQISEFRNQSLESRLHQAEGEVDKAAYQVEEIVRAANMDASEMARIASSLQQMIAAKNDSIRDSSFQLIRLKKGYNDALETFYAKLKLLGIPTSDIDDMGFRLERLPVGAAAGPADLVVKG
jgi:chromosome segregation ATPase